jgi:hypothetical protein
MNWNICRIAAGSLGRPVFDRDDEIRRVEENDPTYTHVNVSSSTIRSWKFIEKNTHIVKLTASYNHIGGALGSIACVLSLTRLNLRDTELVDISPLGKLIGLTHLDISYNQIETIKPLSECVNLEELFVTNNKIASLDGIDNLTRLVTLNASNNQLLSLKPVRECVNLEDLECRCNGLVSLEGLESLPHLVKVKCSSNQIGTLIHLNGCDRLSSIEMGNNPISDLSSLATMRSLTSIGLVSCHIKNVDALITLPNLQKVEVYENALEDSELLKFTRSPTIESIDVKYMTQNIPGKGSCSISTEVERRLTEHLALNKYNKFNRNATLSKLALGAKREEPPPEVISPIIADVPDRYRHIFLGMQHSRVFNAMI